MKKLVNEVKSLQPRPAPLAGTPAYPHSVEAFEGAETERKVRYILRLRRRRDALFGPDLFGEPAWDMLLELYAADLAGRRESVSGLCSLSGVPSTTALRWVRMLEYNCWIVRSADPLDGRRSFLSLTDKAKRAMEAFFGQPELVGVN